MNAPIVFQCGGCHRVVSDSNQLLSAVADLDILVLDAVVGVRVADTAAGADDVDNRDFALLHCSACDHQLGRVYSRSPQPALDIVHRDGVPRYALVQSALASYVLGSAALHVADSQQQRPNARELDERGVGAADDQQQQPLPQQHTPAMLPQQRPVLQLVDASGEASFREQLAGHDLQLTQLMRVVLALDARLRSLEDGGQEPEAGDKRPRV